MIEEEKQKRGNPLVKMQKLHCQGASYTMVIPKVWLDAHGIDPEKTKQLLIVANRDIRIVNPNHEQEVYREVSKIVKDTET